MNNTTKYKNSPLGMIPEDWEVKKLNEVAGYVDYRGKTPKKTDSGILLLTARNIKQGYIDYDVSKEFISGDDYANVMSRGLPEIGDVLVTTEAPMGNVAQINRLDVALAQRVIKFRAKPKVITNDYLKYYLLSEKFQRILDEKSTGGTVKGIKGSTLHKMVLISPPLPEQTAIANCLSTWDQAIAAQTHLIAQKELRKKALMQQLLSGKKRLKGFSGEWREVKLGKVGELTSSKRVYLSDYVNQGIPFYRGKEITELKQGKVIKDILFISEKVYDDFKEKYGVPQINDILITAVGTLGNVYRISNDNPFYFKDGNLIWIRNIKEHSMYLEYLLNNSYEDLYNSAIGSSQKALTIIALNKLKFKIPSIEEQTAIANVLQCADEELHLLKTKLAQLKEQKKGLMQVLLTGKKRLRF
jgi:type I restriction enzyme S subunit